VASGELHHGIGVIWKKQTIRKEKTVQCKQAAGEKTNRATGGKKGNNSRKIITTIN